MSFHRSRRKHSNHKGSRHHGNGALQLEPNGLHPGDDLGNRRMLRQEVIPADDIGNLKIEEEVEEFFSEDLGNRIDVMPTHGLCGVLWDLDHRGKKRKPKPTVAPEKAGRWWIGGVNPLVASIQRATAVVVQAAEAELAAAAQHHIYDDDHRRAQHPLNYFLESDEEKVEANHLPEDVDAFLQEAVSLCSDVFKSAQLHMDVQYRILSSEQKHRGLLVFSPSTTVFDPNLLVEGEFNPAYGIHQRAMDIFDTGGQALLALNHVIHKAMNPLQPQRLKVTVLPHHVADTFVEFWMQDRQREKERAEAAMLQTLPLEETATTRYESDESLDVEPVIQETNSYE